MKVLIIEDEPSIIHFLIRGFKNEHHEVIHVEDGAQALEKIITEEFDIIILDLILPGMSGEEILGEIRKRKDSTPVIVLTCVGDSEIKTKLLNAGADDYLVKPFSFVELSARTRSILRRVKGQQKKVEELSVGDLKLFPERHQVTRAERNIKLRLKEYVLLAYLMENKDKVISRNTLIEQVWDYNAQLFSNTVDSHISQLRKKINKGHDIKLIETVHGIGYVLNSQEAS